MARKAKNNIRFPRTLLFYLPLLAGAIFILILILHFGFNTPIEDQWEMVPLFQKAGHHTLGFSDVWHQHNEHRIFFPLLVALANAYVTNWNTQVETLIGLVFAVVTASLLFVMLRQSVKQLSLKLVAGVLVAAWFFSPIQWENWLWGWQLEWFMAVAGSIATIFLLLKFLDSKDERRRNILYSLALVTAIIANYSLASGVLAWAVGLFVLLVGRQSRKAILGWISAGVVANLLYYYHYVPVPAPSGGSPAHVLIHSPIAAVKFFLLFLGSPVGSADVGMQTPYLIGSLLLLALLPVLYLVWQRRQHIRLYLPWLTVILLALLADASTTFGRLGYGLSFALNSRYTAFSLLYIIGFIGLAFTLLAATRSLTKSTQRLWALTIVLVCVPMLASSYHLGIQGFQKQSYSLGVVYRCTHLENATDDCLRATYPSAQAVRPRLEYLLNRHWAGY